MYFPLYICPARLSCPQRHNEFCQCDDHFMAEHFSMQNSTQNDWSALTNHHFTPRILQMLGPYYYGGHLSTQNSPPKKK